MKALTARQRTIVNALNIANAPVTTAQLSEYIWDQFLDNAARNSWDYDDAPPATIRRNIAALRTRGYDIRREGRLGYVLVATPADCGDVLETYAAGDIVDPVEQTA